MKKQLLTTVILLVFAGSIFAQNTNRIEAANKSVTGMTSSGGSKGYGVAYHFDPNSGNDSLLLSFNGNGALFLANPNGSVIEDTNNKMLYGMAYAGGAYNYGGIFYYNPKTLTDSIVFSFSDTNGANPLGSLVQASDGLLYGMTWNGGSANHGVLFSFDPVTNKERTLLNFNGTNGAQPEGNLMQASNGLLYGMTSSGGSFSSGVLFGFNPFTNKDSVLLNFNGTNGAHPNGSLMQASNGLLYGMTFQGGSSNYGVLFSYDTLTGKDSVWFNFTGTNGQNPNGSLMQDTNGLLYGMTNAGGSGFYGVIFSYTIGTNKDSVLYNFYGGLGGAPEGSLMRGSDGLLYGTTYSGGTKNYGVLFSFDPTTKNENVLQNFMGLTGKQPYADVLQASDGMLYGMTLNGGTAGSGVLFRYNLITSQDTVLLNFTSPNQQTYPLQNGLMQASNGFMYGLTNLGGTDDLGTLFSYNPTTGKDSILVNFNGTTGSSPSGALIQAHNGLLYGMTGVGIFSFNPIKNKDSLELKFSGPNGSYPFGSLVQASDSLLYGLAEGGGLYGMGVLFSFNTKTGKDSIRINFNDTNGAGPNGTLIQAADGLLYGTTYQGGKYSNGMLFSYDPVSGKYDTLLSLNYSTIGSSPQGNVIVDTAAHVIYAEGQQGQHSNGALFSFNMKTKTATRLVSYGGINGSAPTCLLKWDTAANFVYSTTYQGGSNNYGVLHRYDPILAKDTTLLHFHDVIGANPCGILLANKLVGPPSAVNKIAVKKHLIIAYPNPFIDNTTVQFAEEGKHYIELDDLQGNKLRWLSTNNKQYNITRDGLAAGIYLVKFYDSNQRYLSTTKIVVQ